MSNKTMINKIIRDTIGCTNSEAVLVREHIDRYVKDWEVMLYEYNNFKDQEITKLIKKYGNDFLYAYNHGLRF